MALIKTPKLKRPPNELKKDDYLEGRQKNDLSYLSNEQ